MSDSAVNNYNPFVRRSSYQRSTILAYQAASFISWLLVGGFGIYYATRRPHGHHGHHGHEGKPEHGTLFWDDRLNAFSQTKIVNAIYWIVLLLSQVGYVSQFFSSDAATLDVAANVAPYFVLNNLFVLAFTLLFVHAKFWWAEVFSILSLINQATLYWSFPQLHPVIHFPAVAGPYAWSLLTVFWNAAVAIGSNSTPLRIVANVFIWGYFVYGQAHIVIRNDQYFGYSLTLLTLSLALKQVAIKIISLQWIFAFTIFGIFLASSLWSSVTNFLGLNFFLVSHEQDGETEPLLGGAQNA